MPLPTILQFNIILYSFLAGILIGGMFDLYRIIRGANVPKIVVIIEDILFWILAALVVFCFLLYTNYAFLGTYVYVFMFISLFIYLKLISPVCVKLELTIIRVLGKVTRVALKNIIYPIKIIFYSVMGKNNWKWRNNLNKIAWIKYVECLQYN